MVDLKTRHVVFRSLTSRTRVQSSMIGASCCCHVTLLILLLMLRLTFANIHTSSVSSSSSSAASPLPASSLVEPSRSSPQSSSISPEQALDNIHKLPKDIEKYPTSNSNEIIQSKPLLVNIDQSKQTSAHESPSSGIQSNATLQNNIQSNNDSKNLKSPVTSLSEVMKTISSTPEVDHIPHLNQSNDLILSNSELKQIGLIKNEKKLLAIERLFLQKFGLARRPQIEAEYAVPEYMLNLYHSQNDDSQDDRRHLKLKGNGPVAANTVRSFSHTDVESSSCQSKMCSRVHFDITTIPDIEKIVGVEFRVFVNTSLEKSPQDSAHTETNNGDIALFKDRSPFRIEVHEIIRPDSENGDVFSRLLDTQIVLHINSTSWYSFDVRPAVLRWSRGPSHNHGLEVRMVTKSPGSLTDDHVSLRKPLHVQVEMWAVRRPLLVVFTNDDLSSSSSSSDKKLKRIRRQAADKDTKNKKKNRRKKHKRKRKKKGNKNICRRHDLFVNFNDVGWDDWIVAPPGYSAYYCQGDCMAPLPDFTKASNHAMLQARVYKVFPNSVPMVCCVPSKMTQISMLYRDEKGRTVLKNYQDMAVTECSCK